MKKQSKDCIKWSRWHSESDANLAVAVESIILGFNVRADNAAKKIIEEENIPLSYHSIIYELLDDVKARMSGLA
jgi:translation initiation factor IF-2